MNTKKKEAAAPPPEPDKAILIAEDSPPNRRILAFTLQKIGFGVVDCADGEEAWAKLNSEQAKKIVAVFSDIMMPKLSGLQLLEKIREQDSMKSLPVVLISAVQEKDSVVKAKELGIQGYIIKPIRFDLIQNMIRKLFPDHDFEEIRNPEE